MSQDAWLSESKHRGSSFWKENKKSSLEKLSLLLKHHKLMVYAICAVVAVMACADNKRSTLLFMRTKRLKNNSSLSPLLWWCNNGNDHDDRPSKIKDPKTKSRGRPLKIACVGDSLTRGDGSHEKPELSPEQHTRLKERGNYPNMLQSLLQQDGTTGGTDALPSSAFDVRNFGQSGATACNSSDKPYIRSTHLQNVLKFEPDIVVLMFGTNDAKVQNRLVEEGGSCGEKDEKVRLGIEEIISSINQSKSTSSQIPILLILPPPAIEEKWGIRLSLLPSIRDEIRSIRPVNTDGDTDSCNSNPKGSAVSMISADSFIPADPTHFVSDGIHLNRRGTQKIACAVFRYLVDQFRCAGCNIKDNENNVIVGKWGKSLGQCDTVMQQ